MQKRQGGVKRGPKGATISGDGYFTSFVNQGGQGRPMTDQSFFSLIANRYGAWLDRRLLETEAGRSYLYGDLEENTAKIAGYLTALGLKKGDRIAAQIDKSPEALFLYLGCLRAGLVYVPINPDYRAGEVDHVIADCAPKAVVAAGRLVAERRTQVEGLGRGLPDPVRLMEELVQRLDERAERLATALRTWLQTRQAEVARLSAALPHPRQHLKFAREHSAALGQRLGALGRRLAEPQRQALDRLDAGRRLSQVMAQRLTDRVTLLEGLGRVLESTSYHNVLARGFAVVRGPDGLLTGPEGVAPGLALDIEFAQDRHLPAVAGTTGVKRKTPARETAARGSAKDDPQGSLL